MNLRTQVWIYSAHYVTSTDIHVMLMNYPCNYLTTYANSIPMGLDLVTEWALLVRGIVVVSTE